MHASSLIHATRVIPERVVYLLFSFIQLDRSSPFLLQLCLFWQKHCFGTTCKRAGNLHLKHHLTGDRSPVGHLLAVVPGNAIVRLRPHRHGSGATAALQELARSGACMGARRRVAQKWSRKSAWWRAVFKGGVSQHGLHNCMLIPRYGWPLLQERGSCMKVG